MRKCNIRFGDRAPNAVVSCLEEGGAKVGRQQKVCFVALSIEVHQSGLSRLAGLRIRNAYVFHRRPDSSMPQAMPRESQIHVACNQMRSERMF